MTELLNGVCRFVIIEDVSAKGKKYKRVKLIFNDYEKDYIGFVNDETVYCIRKALQEK